MGGDAEVASWVVDGAVHPLTPMGVGVQIILDAPFGSALGDDSLPAALSLPAFSTAHKLEAIVAIGLHTPPMEDAGEITSLTLVPEPSSGLLLAWSAILLIASRRTRLWR